MEQSEALYVPKKDGGHGFFLPFSYSSIDMYAYAFMEFCGSVVSVLNKNKRNKYHEIISLKGYVIFFII
jgi:hypothetical protein